MAKSEERSAVGGWKTSPVVWGGLFVLTALLVAVGVMASIDRRDVWVRDVFKAFSVAVITLLAAIDLRRRGRRDG